MQKNTAPLSEQATYTARNVKLATAAMARLTPMTGKGKLVETIDGMEVSIDVLTNTEGCLSLILDVEKRPVNNAS